MKSAVVTLGTNERAMHPWSGRLCLSRTRLDWDSSAISHVMRLPGLGLQTNHVLLPFSQAFSA